MTKDCSQNIFHQVPPDYYQKGVRNNLLQRFWHTGKFKAVLSLIESNPKFILDVGSASGWFLSKMSKRFPKAKCVGVDVYKNAITYGKNKYKSIRFVHADAHKLPFQDDSFDMIVCTEVLEHVTNPKGVLKEIRRVLKQHGAVVIEMDTGNILFNIVWYLWMNFNGKVWKGSHLHKFSSAKLEKMIKDCGFLIEKKKLFNFKMAVVFSSKKL